MKVWSLESVKWHIRFLRKFSLTFISITVCRALVLAESGAFSNLRCISYTREAKKRVSVLLFTLIFSTGEWRGKGVVVTCKDDYPGLVRYSDPLSVFLTFPCGPGSTQTAFRLRGTGGSPSLHTWLYTVSHTDPSHHKRWSSGTSPCCMSLFHRTLRHIIITPNNPKRGLEIVPF